MKYILTTIAIFFSLLAAGQIWHTPVDTIVPGTRDTVPIMAVTACPGDKTPDIRYIYQEMVWDKPYRSVYSWGLDFTDRPRSWQFVKYLDEKFDSLTCFLVSSIDLPRPAKSYPSVKNTLPSFHVIGDTIYSRKPGGGDTTVWIPRMDKYPHFSISDSTSLRQTKFRAHAVLVAAYNTPHRVEMIKNCEVEEVMVQGHRLWKIDGWRKAWPIAIMRKGANRWELIGW